MNKEEINPETQAEVNNPAESEEVNPDERIQPEAEKSAKDKLDDPINETAEAEQAAAMADEILKKTIYKNGTFDWAAVADLLKMAEGKNYQFEIHTKKKDGSETVHKLKTNRKKFWITVLIITSLVAVAAGVYVATMTLKK